VASRPRGELVDIPFVQLLAVRVLAKHPVLPTDACKDWVFCVRFPRGGHSFLFFSQVEKLLCRVFSRCGSKFDISTGVLFSSVRAFLVRREPTMYGLSKAAPREIAVSFYSFQVLLFLKIPAFCGHNGRCPFGCRGHNLAQRCGVRVIFPFWNKPTPKYPRIVLVQRSSSSWIFAR